MWHNVTIVAKFLNLNNLSWQRWPFALLKDGRKVWATILLLGAITHRKVLSIFSFSLSSFLQYLQDHCLLRSRNFVSMVTWCNDFSSLLHIGVHSRVWMCSGEAGGMGWGCVILWSSIFFEPKNKMPDHRMERYNFS